MTRASAWHAYATSRDGSSSPSKSTSTPSLTFRCRSGDKFFATNAGFASFLVVIARAATNPAEHMAIVVSRDTPGVRIVKRWEMIDKLVRDVRHVSIIEGGDDVLRDLVFHRYVQSEDLRV